MSRRGQDLPRCARCALSEHDCLCANVQQLVTKTQIALVLHRRELGNPAASEGLVLSAFPNCRLFVQGHKDQPVNLDGLYEQGRRVLLLYPGELSRPLTPQLVLDDPREVTLIVPGGSLRQAGRAARRIPGAARAEQVTLPPLDRPIDGMAPRRDALSTYEAIAQALVVLEGHALKDALAAAFALRRRPLLPGDGSTSRAEPLSALDVLYADEYLVAVDKPSGFLVHRGWGEEGPVLLQLLRDQLGRTLYPVHRLDRQTSGAILLSFYPEVARDLQAAFVEQHVQKRYLALCRGHDPNLMRIEHPLTKEPGKGTPQPALTELTLLGAVGRYGLYEVRPRTGRTHQIRRHLKHVSQPLIGDVRYGKGEHNRFFREQYDFHRLALHCSSLAFKHPRTAQSLFIQARLPPDFANALTRLGLGHLVDAEDAVAPRSLRCEEQSVETSSH